jgi:exonuclease SbcC
MIPNRLRLHNFLSYETLETLDFSGMSLAVLTGANGVGKSSLLEAMTWVLWGEARAASDDDLIHQGEHDMWVEFLFDLEDIRYKVVRTRERKGRTGITELEFQIQEKDGTWKPLTGPTLKVTQQRIDEALHLTFDLFTNASYFRQGHADEFTTKAPGERKEILAQILDLSVYDLLEETAREKKREIEGKESLYGTQVEDAKMKLAELPTIREELSDLEKEEATLKEAIEVKEKEWSKAASERERYESISREITYKRERYEALAGQLNEMVDRGKQAKEKIGNLEKLVGEKENIEKEFTEYLGLRKKMDLLSEKAEQYSLLQQKLAVLNHKQDELQRTVERLEHIKTCPTCLRVLSKSEAEKIIKTLTLEFEKTTKPEIDKVGKAITDLKYSPEEVTSLREKISELSEVEDKKRALAVAESEIKSEKEILADIEKRFKAGDLELKKLGEEGKSLKKDLEVLEKKAEEWRALEEQRSTLSNKYADYQRNLGSLKEKVTGLEKLLDEIKQKESDLKKFGEEKGIYDELIRAFGKRGVQAMIIEQTVPQIEEEANKLLDVVTDGRMRVHFVTQKAKKTGDEGVIETLDIHISDELGERPYEQFSGGEAFRINFAIRVAMSKLLASRAGARLQFLAIDEGFGALDQAGTTDIIQAINAIRGDFAKVLIITHLEEFKNAFPTRIEVTKDNRGSHITTVSE